MIETLDELCATAGVERMNISIQKTSKARVSVTIQSILGAIPDDAADDIKSVRHALAAPILIEGVTGEVDAQLENRLTRYVKAATPMAQRLATNLESVTSAVDAAGETTPPEGTLDAEEVVVDSSNDSFTSDEATSL